MFLSEISRNNSEGLSNFPDFLSSVPRPIPSLTLETIFLFNDDFILGSFFIVSSYDILFIIPSIKSDTCFKNKVFLSSKIEPMSSSNWDILSLRSSPDEENISSNFAFNILIPSNLFEILGDNKFFKPSSFI